MKGYAEGVGYDASHVSKYRNAATVYKEFITGHKATNEESIKGHEPLLELTRHLSEIHKAPADCWRVLVELLLKKEWTVAETPLRADRRGTGVGDFRYQIFMTVLLKRKKVCIFIRIARCTKKQRKWVIDNAYGRRVEWYRRLILAALTEKAR